MTAWGRRDRSAGRQSAAPPLRRGGDRGSLLAGVGTRSGHAFFSALLRSEGLVIVAAGAVITVGTALAFLLIGYGLFRIPMSLLIGMLAGLQTQPAVLAFAGEQTGNDLPAVGYATVFPLATVVKIVVAQLLLTLLA